MKLEFVFNSKVKKKSLKTNLLNIINFGRCRIEFKQSTVLCCSEIRSVYTLYEIYKLQRSKKIRLTEIFQSIQVMQRF